MDFEARKQRVLSDLFVEDHQDLSPKGSLDAPIVELLKVVNKQPDFYTTSSCSGRISLFLSPPKSAAQFRGKGGKWALISHEIVPEHTVFAAVTEALKDESGGDLSFKFEPFILAVECASRSAAAKLLDIAIASGFRESGMVGFPKRFMVSVRCSLRLEAPLIIAGALVAPHSYISVLINEANKKFRANQERIDAFFANFCSALHIAYTPPAPVCCPLCNFKFASPPIDVCEMCGEMVVMREEKRANLQVDEKEEQEADEDEEDEDEEDRKQSERRVWCVLTAKQSTKIVKDALKERKWLNRNFAITPLPPYWKSMIDCDSLIAIPITKQCKQQFNTTLASFSHLPLSPHLPFAHQHAALSTLLFPSSSSPPHFPLSLQFLQCKRIASSSSALHSTGGKLDSVSKLKSVLCQFAIDRKYELPSKWEQLGDLVLFPGKTDFARFLLSVRDEALLCAIAAAFHCSKLAIQHEVDPGGMRQSRAKLLFGASSLVEHKENGVIFCFDVVKCMFSSGNGTERMRMAKAAQKNENIVDLFCGIGYFSLPILVHAKPAFLYACEWNPDAVQAFQHGLSRNMIAKDKCEVVFGDNRELKLSDWADRVLLGLLPTSEGSYATAVQVLKPTGGFLHVHENVSEFKLEEKVADVCTKIKAIAERFPSKCQWNVSLIYIEKVKWYAPHVRHVVFDIWCHLP